ncbi:hypothetical protein [Pseudomonas knackmussii]|uniref:hypothetical protein n=1 Tax=Pseudomonas knackmussii TaxID=65741 RepID=UPI003F4A3BA9
MYQVKYDMPDAQKDFEFILEQLMHGAEIIIIRYGIEVARITAIEGLGGCTLALVPCQRPSC